MRENSRLLRGARSSTRRSRASCGNRSPRLRRPLSRTILFDRAQLRGKPAPPAARGRADVPAAGACWSASWQRRPPLPRTSARPTAWRCTMTPQVSPGLRLHCPRAGTDWLVLGGIAELEQGGTSTSVSHNLRTGPANVPALSGFLPVLERPNSTPPNRCGWGLRPYSASGERRVRLEREADTRVVHNYGHGGGRHLLLGLRPTKPPRWSRR